ARPVAAGYASNAAVRVVEQIALVFCRASPQQQRAEQGAIPNTHVRPTLPQDGRDASTHDWLMTGVAVSLKRPHGCWGFGRRLFSTAWLSPGSLARIQLGARSTRPSACTANRPLSGA